MRLGYTEEHEQFRATARAFLDKELDAKYRTYMADGGVGREFWRKAGQAGLLGMGVPEEYGGPGADLTYSVILAEEVGASIGSAYMGVTLMGDLAHRMLVDFGTDAQKRRYAPGILAGEIRQAFPLTEPSAGSDATAIRATAVRQGDQYIINGEKYFISHGSYAELLYVVVKTDPTKRGSGMSVILVEANTPGLTRNKIPMVGWNWADTSALSFSDVRVPTSNLLGEEGGAMKIMMSTFTEDRLQIAARCIGAATTALKLTVDYVRQRKAFGQRIADFQNTQFALAEVRTDIDVARVYLDHCLVKARERGLTVAEGAMLKLSATEMEGRVVDKCLQLFGGAGMMQDTPIGPMYTAARIQRIYAGTSELQKVSIARELLGS